MPAPVITRALWRRARSVARVGRPRATHGCAWACRGQRARAADIPPAQKYCHEASETVWREDIGGARRAARSMCYVAGGGEEEGGGRRGEERRAGESGEEGSLGGRGRGCRRRMRMVVLGRVARRLRAACVRAGWAWWCCAGARARRAGDEILEILVGRFAEAFVRRTAGCVRHQGPARARIPRRALIGQNL